MKGEKFVSEGADFRRRIPLIPARSEAPLCQVNLNTRVTKTVKLNTPLLSAAMDTVNRSGDGNRGWRAKAARVLFTRTC